MKKIYTFSIVALAFMFAQNANAQSSSSVEEKAKAQTASNNAPAQTVVAPATTQAKSTQVVTVATTRPEDKKMQAAREEVAAYEAKINANRNTPGFDVEAAEAKLRQLKDNYGIK
ncbi:MAG: hypothetical protein AB7G44_00365 [Bacteroidia bacterium]